MNIRYNIVTANMSLITTLTNATFIHTTNVYDIIRILYIDNIAETIYYSSDLPQDL